MRTLFRITHQAAVPLYRFAAVITLYGILLSVIFYASMAVYFAVSNNWVVPIVLSKSDDKGFDMLQKVLTMKSSLETLSVECERLRASIEENRQHRSVLQNIKAQFDQAIVIERSAAEVDGSELSRLNEQKRADNFATRAVVGQTNGVRAQIERELQAGLITKSDAAIVSAGLNQVSNAYTDGEVGEVLLRDQIQQKTMTSTKTLDLLRKVAELNSQIAQLDIAIRNGDELWKTECSQVDRLTAAITVAEDNPLYPATLSSAAHLSFAFLPYGTNLSIGGPIYDCYAGMIGCYQVGSVTRIFDGEHHGEHPIFKTDLRGFVVQINVTRPQAEERKVLFLRKPLWL